MGKIPLILGLVLIAFAVVLWIRARTSERVQPVARTSERVQPVARTSSEAASHKEGFFGSYLDNGIMDRTNPLGAQQNPLQNPAAPIGISEIAANQLRFLTQVALNPSDQVANGDGTVREETPDILIGPRIDDERSFLGLVEFCKKAGAAADPFANPKFAQYCGVCTSSGTLITGESFNTPTGVVVYPKDKEQALKQQKTTGDPFPRVVPSLRAAQCQGAPNRAVLAIRKADLDLFTQSANCRQAKHPGDGCGLCLATGEYTIAPTDATLQEASLVLLGRGVATVSVSGTPVGKETQLSETDAAVVALGSVPEGAIVEIAVDGGAAAGGPMVAGELRSYLPNESVYKLPLEKFIQKDAITGSFPRRTLPAAFRALGTRAVRFTAAKDQPKLVLQGPLPLTFLQSDNLAAIECPASPLVTLAASAAELSDDPCLSPAGQGPGNYTDECIRKRVLEGGCSSKGSWVEDPASAYAAATAATASGPLDIAGFSKWLASIFSSTRTDPALSIACHGENISTPCDSALADPTAVPDAKCLAYLYSKPSSYPGTTQAYTSLGQATKDIQFCTPEGTLNPSTSDGLAELTTAATGYKGLQGVDAVKKYLSEVYTRAVGDLDANLPDEAGGRKTSIQKCFGVQVADAAVAQLRLNGQKQVPSYTNQKYECDTGLPTSFTPTATPEKLGTVRNNGDFVLSFNITPTGIVANWGSILMFSGTSATRGRLAGACCEVGDRMPSIWFQPANLKLHVRIGDKSEANWGLDTDALPLNQTSAVRLQCVGNQVMLTVNDRVYYAYQPTSRPTAAVVNVFSGSAFQPAAQASITDLCYTPLN